MYQWHLYYQWEKGEGKAKGQIDNNQIWCDMKYHHEYLYWHEWCNDAAYTTIANTRKESISLHLIRYDMKSLRHYLYWHK